MARCRLTPVRPMEPTNENLQDPGDDPSELWESFRSSSTLHGFNLVSQSKCSIRRIAWVILSACGVLLFQLKGNVDKWKKHDVFFSTEFKLPKRLPFPAVSICNQNMMRKSKIEGKDGQRYIDSLFGANKTSDSEPAFNIEQEVLRSGHNLTEMIYECTFAERNCTAEEFGPFFSSIHGRCYTFNSAAEGRRPVLHALSRGIGSGLAIILKAQPDEYYGKYSLKGTGFKIMVHDQKRMPWMEGDGRTVSPGFATSIKINRKEFSRLPSPYKSHCGNKSLMSSQHYSKTRCEAECISRAIVAQCNCRPLGIPDGHYDSQNGRSCSTPADIKCFLINRGTISLQDCDCPCPCKEVQYSAEVSSLYFPSRPRLDEVVQYYKTNYKEYYEYYISQHSQADYEEYVEKEIRKSFVAIDVYYETLATTVIEERPAYALNDILADFGGSMGLFLGCSLLTLVEFVDFLVLVCLAFWRKRRGPRTTHPEIAA